MNPLQLFLLFAKIAVLTFGGGYAMIPLFQYELVTNNKLIASGEFANLIALAQVTPGPIGLNAATYIGYQQCGFWGALCATIGVVLPSLILIILLVFSLNKIKENSYFKGVIGAIRAVTLGLIFSAVIFFAETSVFTAPFSTLWQGKISDFGISWTSLFIFALTFALQKFTKLSVLQLMLIAAFLGFVSGYIPVM
ncbi:MAG: chromate transporter [Lentisphaeria bacterium]|nr:chromate transporter [Lentisphaeria bacterium]